MVADMFVILESQEFVSQDKTILISSQEDFTPAEAKLPVFENEDNDSSGTDDFDVRTTRSGKKRVDSPAIKKKNKAGVSSVNVISTKRASKRAKKWSLPVEALRPGKFLHLHKARLLKNFILSKHGREKFRELVFIFTFPHSYSFLYYSISCYIF